MTVKINTAFDAGSIEIIDITKQSNLQIKIRKDTNSHFAQWFYFQLHTTNLEELSLNFVDMDKTAYPDGWKNYNICMSYDNIYWFRVKSKFKNNTLSCTFKPEKSTMYFAYFEPYSYEMHLSLINEAVQSDLVKHEVLGSTHEGRNIDLLIIGDPKHNTKIWITARQHPGETMAEHCAHGLIHRLLDLDDSISNKLLLDHVFYIVPNMNPDGAYHGNLRVNTRGTNLNREWLTPSLDKSPEVYYVRKKMEQVGVDVFLDLHGDENLPYVFTAGCTDNPSYSDKQKRLTDKFDQSLLKINPDYQTKYGYEKNQFTEATPTLATNWVGNKFDCLALTLEFPFKDNDNRPDPLYGWNGRRSYLFGESLLTALNMVMYD